MITKKSVAVLVISLLVIKPSYNRQLFEKAVHEISAVLDLEHPIQIHGYNNTKLQIAGLTGTLYSNSLAQLQNIAELRIVRNQINEIQEGALCSSPSLKILELDLTGNNNPPTLRKEHFKNCFQIQELFLKFDYNRRSKIDEDALQSLSKLKTLGIDCQNVGHLKKGFLKLNSRHLKTLILSDWNLNRLDSEVFDEFVNLEELQIVHNFQLEDLPRVLFQTPNRIKRLVLSDNSLRGLSWEEFKGLNALEELNVFDNKIDSLDVNKIHNNMPKLKIFNCQLNMLSGEQVERFLLELKTKFNHTVSASDFN